MTNQPRCGPAWAYLVAGAILVPLLHGLARGFGELSAGDLGLFTPALAIIGAALGGLAAIAAGLVIQAEVFGVAGVDIATLGGSAAMLASAMFLASILPAWRAARLDPNAVLREE